MTQQLPEILQPHSDLLETLAEVWLKTGAAHVAIWGEGQVFANWSNKPTSISSSQPTYTQISAAIKVDEDVIGHLYVFGQNDRISKKRLRLDASLIAAKIKVVKMSTNGQSAASAFAKNEAIEEKVRSHELQTEEVKRQLNQVQKQFDALVRLNQYQQQEIGGTIDDWLTFFRKTVLDLIPSQLVFTLDDQGEEALILDSHPVRVKDAEDVAFKMHKENQKYSKQLENAETELHRLGGSTREDRAATIIQAVGRGTQGLLPRPDHPLQGAVARSFRG